jgi:hypothetical protein
LTNWFGAAFYMVANQVAASSILFSTKRLLFVQVVKKHIQFQYKRPVNFILPEIIIILKFEMKDANSTLDFF